MLRGLAADEGRARHRASARDARHDVGDALRHDLAARDVVGHEEGTRTDHDDVVDDHADEVLADGVVLVDRLRDRDLGPDAVGARREERARVVPEGGGVEETGETADPAEHLGPVRSAHGRLHQFDGEISGGGIDACGGVWVFVGSGSHRNRLPGADTRGHRESGARPTARGVPLPTMTP